MENKIKLLSTSLVLLLSLQGCSKDDAETPNTSTKPTDSTLGNQCSSELDGLKSSLMSELNSASTDSAFTLLLKTKDLKSFEHSVGNSSKSTMVESASTSKLVAATVILDAVKIGKLNLDSHPQDFIEFWPSEGSLSDITLRDLLSFTSGLSTRAFCTDIAGFDFEACVENIKNNNLDKAPTSGSEFYYGPNHLQVAGLMTIKALNVASWSEVFDAFKSKTGLFTKSTFDLPSSTNPRIAGGMHWSGAEYLAFLEALYNKTVLDENLLSEMFSDQILNATITSSPALDSINEDWHYGFGNWIECHHNPYSCTQTSTASSPGAFGAYPFINFEMGYYGVLSRKGKLGTFDKGYALFVDVKPNIETWVTKSCN
jgi:CubicO group peptidase (beta-lactamase class C family)